MKTIIAFIQNRIRSFQYAFSGLKDVLLTEHNAWIHAIFTIFGLVLALWLRISFTEFVLIIIVITLVWVAEVFNTVLEVVVNMVSPRYTTAAADSCTCTLTITTSRRTSTWYRWKGRSTGRTS